MLKDKSKLLLLGALVLLFIVLMNGGFNIDIGHFRLFRGDWLGTIVLIALAVWFFSRPGGCFRGCCRPREDEVDAAAESDVKGGEKA